MLLSIIFSIVITIIVVKYIGRLDKYMPNTYPKYKVGDVIVYFREQYETIIKVEYNIRYREYEYTTDYINALGKNVVYYDHNAIKLVKSKINKIIRRNK